MFNTRGAEVSEPEEPRLSVSSVITGLAGSNRSGKHRLLPEESEPAGLITGPLPAQAVRSSTAVPQPELLPGTAGQVETGDRTSAVIPAGQTASRNLAETGGQVGAGASPQEGGGVHQLHLDSDPDLTQGNINMSDNDGNKSDQDEAARVAAAKAAEAAGEGNEVQIIEPSPTGFNPSKMPKTIKSHVFVCAKQAAHSDRVRVMTVLEECDDKVKELTEMEEERDKEHSEDEYCQEIREDISQNMKKVKLLLDSHSHNSHNLGQMCSYILDIMKECPMDKNNLRHLKAIDVKLEKERNRRFFPPPKEPV